jgi:DNA-directed RNA polymerase subunit beta'
MVTFSTTDQFKALQDATSEAVSKIFPVDGKKNIIRLKKHYTEDTLEHDDFEGQKKVKLRGGTWGVPVYGDLELVDKATGRVIDQQTKVKLMSIPKITPRSSYIVNGNEYQVSSQLRRVPGIYTFRKQTGDEFKTVFNLAKGRNFDINFDPKTLKYTMKIGQANPPLYPVLKALGISDEHLHATWGKEILDANRKKSADESANKIAKTLTGNDKATAADLKEYFAKTELHPEMSEKLLGVKGNSITPEIIAKASHKLLEVYRGKQKPDDAESLVYKEVHSVDDFIKDKFKKNLQSIQGKFKRNIDTKDKIKQIISPSVMNKQIESFFLSDERSNATEQYNPLHMLGSHYKVSIMGPGGVSSEHMITPEMREVHTSHLGFLDPIHTPESEKVGATLHLPFAVQKDGNRLLTKVYDVKAKKYVSMSPLDLHSRKVGFPDQVTFDGNSFKGFNSGKVKVQHQGELMEVDTKDVDVVLPTTKSLFSFSTNLIPFLKNNQANRATFAAKQMEQAVPLIRENRQAPLVRTLASKSGATFNDVLGAESSHRSPVDGTVTKVSAHEILVKSGNKTHSVNIYNDFPLNQSTMMNSEPVVKAGDKVKKNQLIADSNFTKNGTLALGTNLRTAYMVWPGATFEDGIAISQSAAKKLTSEHSYKYDHKIDENSRLNLRNFKIEFPSAIKGKVSDNLDEHGVIKKGSVVKSGDILVASMQKRVATPEELALQKTHRSLKHPMQNNSVTFNNDFDGVVTDVLHTPKGVKVIVKTKEEARVGDKLSGLHGNKGIISAIVPDNQAPRNKDGQTVDIMLNPHGVISRINIGQLYESAAGKLANKTGKPYVVENFDNIDHKAKITSELAKHGLTDKEELFDAGGALLGKIHVGMPHVIKLFKTGQSAISARGAGGGYAYDRMNLQPIRGGEDGSKAMDVLTNYAMLSHDSRNIMREMATTKGEKSDEFWNAFRQGRTIPPEKTPFVFNKFLNMLKGAGVDVQKNGSQYKILPQTDEQVNKMSRGAIKSAEFINAKDLKPRRDGFFDEKITGGLFGTQFNHIELPEKMPNPVFEDSIKKLTGITAAQYQGLIEGTHAIDSKGKLIKGSGITGGKAFEHLLGKIDVDSEVKKHENTIKHGLPKDDDFKKLRLLNTLKSEKMTAVQAYMKSLVPVLPPVFRPIYPIDDGSLNISPVNNLYQHVHLLSDAMKLSAVSKLPTTEKGSIRSELYRAHTALAGLGDAVTQKDQGTPGIIAQIAGSQPKEGFFLNKVIRKQQDLTARGTIVPNSDLHVDEIGVPEKAAWKIFEPFITQKMVRHGKSPLSARKEIEEKTPFAKQLLNEVMDERPVMYNRAPSLHKFSIMAGKPKLVSGNAIHIPHLIVKGLGADFDGDAMTLHVPISHAAIQEAKGMFPSKHLLKPGSGQVMMLPSQEGALGTFMLSQTPEGRAIVNKILPKEAHITGQLDAKAANKLFADLAKSHPKEFPTIAQNMKNMSEKKSYTSGFSLGLEDLHIIKDRDAIVNLAEKKAIATKKSGGSDAQIYKHYSDANKELQGKMFSEVSKTNPFRMMVESGARGNHAQMQQIMATPLILKDTKDRPILIPVKKSYTEGLPVSDYFISLYGARKGMMDRALQTSLPGAFTKDLMANVVENVVSKSDCGTKSGISILTNSADALDRYTSHSNKGIPANTLITPDLIKKIESMGMKTVNVRSPLKCLEPKGVCAKCFGSDEHGKDPHIGRNLGALTGQALTEPLTQMQMRSIHSGGMAGAQAEAVGFEKIQQLFNLPQHMTGVVPLSDHSGKVSAITKSPAGGHMVHIGDHQYSVPTGAPLIHKVGDMVHSGDPLALGPIHPMDILKHKGIDETRNYLADQLQQTYKDQGAPIHRKFFENIVRTIANTTKIKKAPLNSPFQVGDMAPLSQVQAYNTANHSDPIQHAPTLIGLTRLPMSKKNWMAQLGYRYAKEAIKSGASEGWTTDVQGYHPIPAFAHGSTFGKGKEGKY